MSASASVNPRHNPSELRVGGLARLSTCDWPGELVATVFCQGCGWDCAYCHNPHLRPAQGEGQLSWNEVLAFLESRRGLLDGVVFSGGEPLLQSAIADALRSARNLGFRIGLHTSGANPKRLSELLPWVDWVGFDVKAPFRRYTHITGVEKSGSKALQSLRILLASGVPYEVRTTLHPAQLSTAEMLDLREELLSLGVLHYAVQQFRSAGTRSDRLPSLPHPSPSILPPDFGDGFRNFSLR